MMTDNDLTFTCWKEIAAYLRKGVRTVQRWERQYGLPVQRPNAKDRGIVRASRRELDHWMRTQTACTAAKAQKPDRSIFPAGPMKPDVATRHELHANNRELLNQLRESLRMLQTNCEQLCNSIGQEQQDRQPESHAA